MDTLTGGRSVIVKKSDGTEESVFARQIPLAEYKAAFLANDDEMKLVALACKKPDDWIYTLSPESYEELQQAVREVNEKGFFVYAARRHAELVASLNSVKTEVLQLASEKALNNLQPGLLPRAG